MRVALLTTDSREHFKDYSNPQPYFGTAPEALLEGFKLMPQEVEVHVISCLQKQPISSPPRLAENIYYHALHVPNIGWLKTGYQGCIRAVRQKLREIRPDIVHGQGTERDCAITAALSGYPAAVTIHGVMRAIHNLAGNKHFDYYWFARHLESFALRRVRGVIAISPYVDALVAPLTPRTWFIPNALQEFFFTPTPVRQRQPGPVRFVNVGVISPRKRQVELLQHLAELRGEVEFEITFVGKASPSDPYAMQFAALLSACQSAHGGFAHVPFLEDSAFLNLYDSADAMIHFSNEESFGLTFAEALARNLPLFASEVGAIRQIAEGVPICRVFGVDDFRGLVTSLRVWIENRSNTESRGRNPNSVMALRYHPKIIAKHHLQVYREILSSRS
jgi:glycosyltransferase involved in cell wall biosynthesis